ncbi:hypothetical protein GLAREA_12510 [Glarea lozoyensis ATCC 20868]|uniref:Magnesium transport protein CorA, transmembrane region n=1 Tax=Glarea lozoyensis (strain ATCC 20868 / MF5171) TaxID=1116229 RepID=S3D3Q1_GLAL2|nr:uncharacterized protein GLAREA_12510 [Glarea lozoyensis ATCC 20868]EPE31754.1 hypothetical protein GLAREA_12510 [Glarea lozoyensis ATCC 20868]
MSEVIMETKLHTDRARGFGPGTGIPDRPTYTRMARKHLSIETLNRYAVPHFIDKANPDYLIIKRWVPEYEQDMLWADTKKLREDRNNRLPVEFNKTPSEAESESEKIAKRSLLRKLMRKAKKKKKASPDFLNSPGVINFVATEEDSPETSTVSNASSLSVDEEEDNAEVKDVLRGTSKLRFAFKDLKEKLKEQSSHITRNGFPSSRDGNVETTHANETIIACEHIEDYHPTGSLQYKRAELGRTPADLEDKLIKIPRVAGKSKAKGPQVEDNARSSVENMEARPEPIREIGRENLVVQTTKALDQATHTSTKHEGKPREKIPTVSPVLKFLSGKPEPSSSGRADADKESTIFGPRAQHPEIKDPKNKHDKAAGKMNQTPKAITAGPPNRMTADLLNEHLIKGYLLPANKVGGIPSLQPQHTVISCSPQRWHSWLEDSGAVSHVTEEQKIRLPKLQDDPLDVHQIILKHLQRSARKPVTTAYDLAGIIAQSCANVFDQHQVPNEFQFFDFFERSIGTVIEGEVQCFHSFTTNLAKLTVADERPITFFDISKETKLLVEIKDIRDELSILQMILNDQASTMRDLAQAILKSSVGEDIKGHDSDFKLNRVLENHLYRIAKMEALAEKTYDSLNHLLNLKQKEASISEALSARKQAEHTSRQAAEATRQAELTAEQARLGAIEAAEATRQGKTVLVFTVLPLSFMAAFFAINIETFPVNSDGKLSLGYVLKYMLSISGATSIPFILVAFNQDRIGRWIKAN